MSRGSKVDEFLSSMLCEGERDSSGTFTLDPTQALKKLAKYQLPGLGWIPLKLVQVAVACRALAVVISVRRRDLVVTFPFPDGNGLEQFSLAQESSASWTRDLQIALRAAGQIGPWMFQVSGLDSGFRTSLFDAEFKREKLACRRPMELHRALLKLLPKEYRSSLVELAGTHNHLAVFRLERATAWWRGILKGATLEHAELTTRLRHCPIPVFVDGQLVNAPWQSRSVIAKSYHLAHRSEAAVLSSPSNPIHTEVYRLPWRMVDLDGHDIDCILASWKGVEKNTGERVPFERRLPVRGRDYVVAPNGSAFPIRASSDSGGWDPRSHLHAWKCRVHILIPTIIWRFRKAHLLPIVHGVALDKLEISNSLPSGTRIIFAAEEFTVDLSGSQLVQDASLEAWIEQITSEVDALLKDAQAAANVHT